MCNTRLVEFVGSCSLILQEGRRKIHGAHLQPSRKSGSCKFSRYFCFADCFFFGCLADAEEEEAVTPKQTTEPTPEKDALKHILARKDKPFLEEMYIDKIKGYFLNFYI